MRRTASYSEFIGMFRTVTVGIGSVSTFAGAVAAVAAVPAAAAWGHGTVAAGRSVERGCGLRRVELRRAD